MSDEELVMGSVGGAWSWLVVPIRTCWQLDRGIKGGWVTWVMEINLRGRESVRGRKRVCYWARQERERERENKCKIFYQNFKCKIFECSLHLVI